MTASSPVERLQAAIWERVAVSSPLSPAMGVEG